MDQQMAPPMADLRRFRELLERLEDHWRRVGAPIADIAAPGLTYEEVDARTAEVGLRLPVEAREWFAWHDGCIDQARWPSVAATRPGPNLIGAVPYRLFSLSSTLDRLRLWLDLKADVERTPHLYVAEPEAFWASSWFPLMAMPHGGTLVVDCAVPEGAQTPVRYADTETDPEPRVCAPSLTAAVELWVDLLDRGVWRYDPATGWKVDPEDLDRIDPQLRYNALAY